LEFFDFLSAIYVFKEQTQKRSIFCLPPLQRVRVSNLRAVIQAQNIIKTPELSQKDSTLITFDNQLLV
jgi:hypothetical protein